jgi:STELLO glycosyltransferases
VDGRTATLITTINSPLSKGVKSLTQWAHDVNSLFIIIGDHKTPPHLDTADGSVIFVSLEEQFKNFPTLAQVLPLNHYSRKNIGYVVAHQQNVQILFETDDDNCPATDIFSHSFIKFRTILDKAGWVNLYRYFGKTNLWPRGLPLSHVYEDVAEIGEICASTKMSLAEYMVLGNDSELNFGAFQSLVDGDPDLDAIGRMLFPGQHIFDDLPTILLGRNQICPTNSQATIWRGDLLPLLYLPITASFRMTDIWRGVIIQEFMSSIGLKTAFGKLNINQERNKHDLIDDFKSEISGHVFTDEVRNISRSVWTKADKCSSNDYRDLLFQIYEELVSQNILMANELTALDAYLHFFE